MISVDDFDKLVTEWGDTLTNKERDMGKKLKDLTDRELDIRIVFSNLEDIQNNADRMTSGNFMHHRAAIKLMTKNVINALHRLGLEDV